MLSVKASTALIIQDMQAYATISETLMTEVNYKGTMRAKRASSILDPYQMFKESHVVSEQVTPI